MKAEDIENYLSQPGQELQNEKGWSQTMLPKRKSASRGDNVQSTPGFRA